MPIEELEIGVLGMSCGHCAARVEKAILAVGLGVESVKVELEGKKVLVRCDTATTSIDKIAAAVEAAGFKPVKPVL
jgi:copper chaperone CopZ